MERDDSTEDPSLARLRAEFAAGHVEDARRAALELSEAGRAQLEARLGKLTVARMLLLSRKVRAAPLGRVVVIHGIMGGKLASIDSSSDEDLVWVNLLRLAGGRMKDFALDANAQPVQGGLRVETRGLLEVYLPLVFELGMRWQVLPFAFDWRLDIDLAAQQLDEEIRRWAAGQPVHIVAHSMGGLVSRRFMQKFPDTWEAMKDPNGLKRGGRLVMLGTPNRGSFAIPLVLTGAEPTVRNLALLDLKHDRRELLDIINTFPGSYQMLPSPRAGAPDDRLKLFEQKTWGSVPVAEAYLKAGRKFQEELDAVKDPERLVYVAGYDERTPYRIRLDGPGEFSYQQTLDGDGRVPHELGLLPGVRTFFVREKHGDLPLNLRVLEGVHELLATGSTGTLHPARPVRREAPDAEWRKAEELPTPAPLLPQPTRALGAAAVQAMQAMSAQEQAALEGLLAASFVGSAAATRTVAAQAPATRVPALPRAARQRPRPIVLEVMWADITQVKDSQVLAVGHYEGVEPQAGELALDKAISGVAAGAAYNPDDLVITSHTRRGIVRGAVGDINFFPWWTAKKTVAVAGMGHPGTFNSQSLRRATRTLAESIAALPGVETVSTLLIGSGNGNMQPEAAVAAMLDGLCDALPEASPRAHIRRVRIVEWNLRKAQRIAAALQECAQRNVQGVAVVPALQTGPGGDIGDDIALSAILLAAAQRSVGEEAAARKAAVSVLQGIKATPELEARCSRLLRELAQLEPDADVLTRAGKLGFGRHVFTGSTAGYAPTRICFTRDPSGLRASAISDTAVVAERVVPVDWQLVQQVVQRMTDPEDVASIPEMGGLMTRLFVPRDFREQLQASDSLVFEVDRETARIQWEMMENFEQGVDRQPIGLDRPVARQLRTAYSPTPPRPQLAGTQLRALVIGDPGDPDKGYDLPGARREALEVTALLRSRGVEVDALIGAPSANRSSELQGIAPATVLDVLRLLDRNSYDILHYAGHGDFDSDDPENRAGWIFGERFFTARELASVARIPSLVVANACLSALTSSKVSGATAEGPPAGSRLRGSDEDLLPGLVDEFFRRGVRNYVGTAWPVNDTGAVLFCQVLYEHLLASSGPASDATLGRALLAARQVLQQRQASYGALWAAYQHYGDPAFVLRYHPVLGEDDEGGAAGAARARKSAARSAKSASRRKAAAKAKKRRG